MKDAPTREQRAPGAIGWVGAQDCSYPLRGGHEVHPWIDGVAFYSRLYEAFLAAQHSVWLMVSFMHRDFAFPQGPSFWDTLDAMEARGLDVRVLFWRNPAFFQTRNLFLGDAQDLAFLRGREARWKARWESSGSDAQHCHHQKCWLVDLGHPTEVGFVGGMTFGKTTLDTPAHTLQKESRHDLCVEVQGPCLADLRHNFVQRWNVAGRPQPGDPQAPTPWPDPAICDDLRQFAIAPITEPKEAEKATVTAPEDKDLTTTTIGSNAEKGSGGVSVQVSRTLQAGRYGLASSASEETGPEETSTKTAQAQTARREGAPAPLTQAWGRDVSHGEESIWLQYQEAFGGAQRSIYIENQHPGERVLLGMLEDALQRGVEVMMVVPAKPMAAIYRERAAATQYQVDRSLPRPAYFEEFAGLERLQGYDNFTMASLARSAQGEDGKVIYREIYVHAKVCLVDGVWGTCGSANFVDLSFRHNHTELNVSFWDATLVRDFLQDLLEEHTHNTLAWGAGGERDWLQKAKTLARYNADCRARGERMQGHIYAIDASRYPAHETREGER